jgi:oleandomycin transport system ATP-binding protein
MRRRLDLAASLVSRPRVLYLDEPTTGLDPRSRNEMWEVVRGLTATGVTVLLTTQYLEEADLLASEIAVIDHGAVIATGSPEELKARTGALTLAVRPSDSADLPAVRTVAAGFTRTEPEVGTSWPGRSASMISRVRSLAPPTSSSSPEPAWTSSGPSIATCTCSILPGPG